MNTNVMNAHRINAGRMPDISNGEKSDFFFLDMEARARKSGLSPDDGAVLAQEAAETVKELVAGKLSRYYRVPESDIQVLTPMQRGVAGAENLNQILQRALNPGDAGLKRGGYVFRARDRVMQIRNNYDKEVFNGDIGVVESVNVEERELSVRFDSRYVTYDISELDELTLAYAVTIHKSQGSEYPIVVIPILMNHYVMLQRNLVYTGITRAKKILVLVGTKKAIGYAIRNGNAVKRNTMLKERLQGLLDHPVPSHTASFAGPDGAARSGKEGTEDGCSVAAPLTEAGMESVQEGSAQKEWLKRDLFERLAQSKFRSRFRLKEADIAYIREKGMDTIRSHAENFVKHRLSAAEPKNDGNQTPMRGAPQGHPIFLAQHATGTCCRGCLEKWHGIPKGRPLTGAEQDLVVGVLMQWIDRQMKNL